MDYKSESRIDEDSPESELSRIDSGDIVLAGCGPILKKSRTKREPAIALVESRTFMRECMHRSLQASLSMPVIPFSTLAELEAFTDSPTALVFLSLGDAGEDECAHSLKVLSSFAPDVPVVVLSTTNSPSLVRTAINSGARGFIPLTVKFEIAIEAVRFIMAGGTYVPIDILLVSRPRDVTSDIIASPSQTESIFSALTDREISIVQAIQEGMSNKVIAYKLCICEGTVKVHLRNIMKKLRARNRTEVALKAQRSAALLQQASA